MAEQAAVPAETPKTEGQQADAAAPASAIEEMLELALEEGKPPVKVPVSKLNPHLAKLRSEADRRLSEADRNSKALAEERGKFENVLKAASERPEEFLEFVKAKGGDPEKILRALGQDPDAWAKKRMEAAVKQLVREAEEAAEPAKREARERDEELDRLRAKDKERDAQDAKGKAEQTYNGLRDKVIQSLELLPKDMRGDAAPEVIAIMRAAHEGKREITPQEAADAAQKYIEAVAEREYKRNDKLRERLGAKPAAVVEHPALAPPKAEQKKPAKREDKSYGIGEALPALLRGEDPAKWPS